VKGATSVSILVGFSILFLIFFSPVWAGGRLLAPGDGFLYHFPHYYAPTTLWDPNLATGFPNMADPQTMMWYPPAALLSSIPGSWNLFVISAYILASWFTCLYVRQLTDMDLSGVVAGLIYGLSGFLCWHLGHTTIIHVAAWIPAILLAIEKMRAPGRFHWIPLGAMAVACCVLAGHLQIAVYGLLLAGAYLLFRVPEANLPRWRFVAAGAAMLGLGLALSAIELIPVAQFYGLTSRAQVSFESFTSFAQHPSQFISFLFPHLLGGVEDQLYKIPYFGVSSVNEVSGYFGYSAILLAGMGLVARDRRAPWRFWCAVAVIALLFSAGGFTPAGRLLYAVPVLNHFRAPGRYVLLVDLAAAVMAGLGVRSLLTEQARRVRFIRVVQLGVVGMAGAFFWILATGDRLQRNATAVGIHHLPLAPWRNPALGIPLALTAAGAFLLISLARRPRPFVAWISLPVLLVAELGSSAWFAEWRYAAPENSDAIRPVALNKFDEALRVQGGRWMVAGRAPYRWDIMPADLSTFWGVPAVGKYGPLLSTRYSELMNLDVSGAFLDKWAALENRAMDLAGARYLAVPDVSSTATRDSQGVPHPVPDLQMAIGRAPCADVPRTEQLAFSQPRPASAIAIVSELACSNQSPQGSPLVDIRLQTADGRVSVVPIRAGIETAEWAADCVDDIRHNKPTVFFSFSTPFGNKVCQGHRYSAVVALPALIDVTRMEFDWSSALRGAFIVHKAVLLDAGGASYAISEQDRILAARPWKLAGVAPGILVYENPRPLPRVWMPSEVIQLTPPTIKTAIQSSRLPDGREYRPEAMALIEEPPPFKIASPDPNARATLTHAENTTVEIHTESRQPGFVVLGDAYYPGWKVLVNGNPAPLFVANYIQRGVFLPAGRNVVRMDFRPVVFYAGVGISTLVSLLLVMIFVKTKRHSR
jgi:hypothetical protein